MSRLNKLINGLCPNGVVHKKLGDAVELARGKRVVKKALDDSGQYEVYQNSLKPLGRYNDFNVEANTTFIIVAGAAGEIGYSKDEFWAADDCFTFKKEDSILSKYLYYVLLSNQNQLKAKVRKASIPRLSSKEISRLVIPLPPLEIQEEIVKILDKFTEYVTELQAELQARRQQYEYYRYNCFKQINKCDYYKLGEICTVKSGGTPSKKEASYWDNGTVKWLSSSVCNNKKSVNIITDFITEDGLRKSSAKMMRPGTTLIALVGATIGKTAYLDFDAAINQNIAGIFPMDPDKVLPDYIYYACTLLYENFINLSKGKLAMANLSFVRNLSVPVPSKEEQQKITTILDKFEVICEDLNSGIPAEIELRQKQYEYYRDKLLTFKELDS